MIVLLTVVGAVVDLDLDFVDVVAVAVARAFKIGRGVEAQHTGRAQRERPAVGPATGQGPVEGIGRHVGVGGQHRADRCLILGGVERAAGNHRRVVGIGDRHGDGLADGRGAVVDLHLDLVDVVAVTVARAFKIGRGVEAQHTAAADREQRGVRTATAQAPAQDIRRHIGIGRQHAADRGLVLGSVEGATGNHRRIVDRKDVDHHDLRSTEPVVGQCGNLARRQRTIVDADVVERPSKMPSGDIAVSAQVGVCSQRIADRLDVGGRCDLDAVDVKRLAVAGSFQTVRDMMPAGSADVAVGRCMPPRRSVIEEAGHATTRLIQANRGVVAK